MLAVMKKLTYDDEYNFENEVSFCFFLCEGGAERQALHLLLLFLRARTRLCLWSTGSS